MEKIILNLELVSSMIHTEETSSNIANIYRETILKSGKIQNIPALHGNSIRGLLRNLAFDNLIALLWVAPATVPQPILNILTSGGSLNGSVVGIDIIARRNIRMICTMLSIFGSALGNEMLQGKLIVSSLLPKCKELWTGDVSYWDMTSIIRYTRVDDNKLLQGEKWAVPAGVQKDAPIQMMYDIEVLNTGVEMDSTFYLLDFSEIEKSCFYTILEEFSKKPFIGGKSSAGHGEVKILNEIDFEKETKTYKEFIENHKDEIKNWIASYK